MKFNFKIKKFIISALAAACVSTAAFGVAGCMPKSVDKTEPTDMNVRNARLAPPTDGSLPTAYSAVENLAYIVGKFDTQTQYHAYTEGVTAASIATQVTRNWKDYKDGILVNSDITYSSMVKGGTQTCTVYGKDEEGNTTADTYFRTSETPGQNTTSTSAVWKQNAPTYFSENAYLYTYGFLPNELFNYAVNSDTVISSEEIKVESDGTYTLKFSLDPKGSTFYYQFGMKTRGGLSDYPDFKFIELTVNFDRDWQINSCDVHEVSNVNKGIVVNSVSDFTAVYTYGEEGFDNEHFGYYENYYKKFLGDGSLEQGGEDDGELVMDVTNVLSNGFAKILNGGQQFEISANLGNNKYVGYVFIGLDLADIAGSINLKASLGKTLNSLDFYVEYANGELAAYYGDDFGLRANLAEVKLEAAQFGEIISKITAAVSPDSGTEQPEATAPAEGGADPLTALMDSMVLVAGENEATLSLKTDDLLGLGIGIDANLVFGISGKTITFRGADIGGLSIGGETLNLDVGLKTTTASLISRNPEKTPADLADYVADVYSLLSSDLIKVSASLNGDSDAVKLSALKGVNVQLDAYADLQGIAVGADATASYTYNGNTVSAKLNVIYEYNSQTGKYGNAYLSLKELNGVSYNVNVRCDVSELVTGISALLNNAGASNSLETGKLVGVLNSALSSDLSSLLTEMYADGAKIKIGVSVDSVLDMLGVDAGVEFGSCELVYERGNGTNGGNLSASLNSIGFSLGVCGVDGELPKPDENDYLDLNDILTDIKSFIDVKTVAVGLTFDGSKFTAVDIAALKDLTASATVYADLNSGLAAQVVANVAYGKITAQITASYIYSNADYKTDIKNLKNGTVVLSLDNLCGVDRNVKIYCKINEVVDGVKTLLGYFGTPQTTAEATTNAGIDLNAVLANLLTADINKIIPDLSASKNVLNLTANVDEVLKLLGVSVGNLSIGNVTLNYTHGGENLLTATAPNFGVVATVNPYNKELPAVSTDDALNLKTVLDDVNNLLTSKKLAVNLSFNGSQFTAVDIAALKDLSASATVYADLNSGLAAQVVANVTYGKITAQITASYIYSNADYKTDIKNLKNGTVVLSLDSLCGVNRNVKIYCNINEVVEGVKTLLGYFGTAQTTAEATASNAIDLNTVLANLLTTDINKIIPDLSASANVLNLTANVDEVLKLLGVSVGNLSIGEVTLNYNHGGENLLTATAPNFGVVATVKPYDKELPAVTIDDALNLKTVLDDVNSLLTSKKLAVKLDFEGSQFTAVDIAALKDLSASATVYADLNSGLAAQVVANVAYGKITAQITASYIYDSATKGIDLNSLKNGTVVLSLDKLCGVDRNVKIYCNINEIVEGVKTLLGYFGTPQTTAEATANTGIDLNTVLANLLTTDIKAIIPDLSASDNVLNLTANVDEVLKLLGINVGNLSIGEVTLNYAHGGDNLLTATAPNFGVVATVNPYNKELPEVSTTDALNLKTVLDDVNSLLTSKKLAVKLDFEGSQFNAVDIAALKDLSASATVYADLNSGLAAQVVANVAYGKITAQITASYIYSSTTNGIDLNSLKNGTVVLSLDSLCGVDRNVKICCNINEVVEGVKTLLGYFGTPQTTAEATANAGIDLNTVLANLLTTDINKIISDLSASKNVLNLTANVDEVLKLLGVSVGNLSIGEVTLNYNHGGENLLTATAPNFGVVATVKPYNENLPTVTIDDALNLKTVLDDVNSLLTSKKLAVGLTFDGSQFNAVDIAALKDLSASATVYADLNSGLAAQVVANVTYGKITAQITASYMYSSATKGIDLNSLKNGTVVLSLDNLCGVDRNVKICCNINEVVEGVNTLLGYFGTPQTTAEATASSAIDLNTVLANLLTTDINTIIPDLSASANVLNLTANVDEVLKLLGISVGNLSIGEVTLNYTHGGDNLLTATAPNFGVVATVTPYDKELPAVSTDDALNLKTVLDDVNSLLTSKKLAVKLDFEGSQFTAVDIAAFKDLTASATVYADLNSGLAAQVVANVAYGKITAQITASYIYSSTTNGIDLNSLKNGTVVLSLDNLCGVDRNVKIYCNINEVVEGVNTLLGYFGTPQTTAEATTNAGIDLNAVLANLLTTDINTIIPDLSASANVLNLTANVDEVLKLLGVSVGNLSIGKVTLNYTHGGDNLLTATVPNFGVVATVNPYDKELPEVSPDDALNLKTVLDDVNNLLTSKKLAVGLTFDGSKFAAVNIAALKDLTASATVYADLNSGLAAQVVANVTYGKITAQITASYIYSSTTKGIDLNSLKNGTVVLSLDNLCGVDRNVKICCNINEVVEGVKTLLGYFGTAQTTAEATATAGIDLNTVLANLLTTDINTIIPDLSASANVLNLTANVDEVLKLLGISVGNLSIGEVTLNYNHGGENLLTATAPNFGVVATVKPYNKELPAVSTDDALNLKEVLDDVNSLLTSKKLAVKLNFNGANLTADTLADIKKLANVDLAALKNLTANATIYADLNSGLTAYAELGVGYAVDKDTSVTATIKLYFSYDKETYGNVMVVLDSINGVNTSVKVRCNISEIKTAIETLLAYVTPKNNELGSATGTNAEGTTQTDKATITAASVLANLVEADITALLKGITADANVLNLTVDIDEILGLLDQQLDIKLGEATLEYKHAKEGEKADLLTATVPNFGVALTVNPTDRTITLPSEDGYLDLSKLVDVVNGAMSQIDTIKKDGKIYFEISKMATETTPATFLKLDGILVQVWGKGEISWAKGQERVALDLSMSIAETGTDETTLKLVYDKNASPMVKVALNNVGLTIYNEDIESVRKGFIEIYNKLAGILGLEPITEGTSTDTTTPTTTQSGTQQPTQNLGSADRLLTVIFGVLAQDDWVNALNNFTLSCDGKSVALGYLTDKNSANVNISTDGALALTYDGAFGERFTLGGSLKVKAVGETPLEVSFAGCNMASSKDGGDEFVRLAYNFLFDCIRSISVENILGSQTYEVKLQLNGANTEVKELKDVYIQAEIYVTNEASINNGKLAEGLLNLDVAGVAINLHVITEYDNSGKARFYINLTRVADILLPDLKVLATQDSLYETFKVLFETVTKTDVIDVVQSLLPAKATTTDGGTTPADQPTGGSQPVNEGTLDKVADILDKVLNLNFSNAVIAEEIEGVQTAQIDLDNLLGQLGLNVGSLGKLSVEINHNSHAMSTSGVANVRNDEGIIQERVWITLSSQKTEKRNYNAPDKQDYVGINRDEYISIEFLPDLIKDIVKFATDDAGKIYKKFTLSGSINAKIVDIINIKIDVSTLTVSLADNDFYFSGLLHVNGVNVLLANIPESTVGITFHKGYLTLARGINTDNPQYKIMTMDYFLDHMLTKEGSVLEWWLNVSGWDTIMGIINKAAPDLSISSGSGTPQDVYMYKASAEKEDQEISMYDFVSALKVILGGKQTAHFGDISSLENEFNIHDNYYGFILNAEKVTGGVLTKLYAALLRNNNGICGVKASGAIQKYVSFDATLDYEEGITKEYEMGTALGKEVVAPSMYTKANEVITAAGKEVNYGYSAQHKDLGYDEKFGCFSTADMSHDPSKVLYSNTLTIVNLDNTTKTMPVRHGSTVYLYDNNSPVYEDGNNKNRIIYSTVADTVGESSVLMDGDMTIYAVRRAAVNVIVHNGTEEITIHSFIGDKVPKSIKGLETISDVTYADGTFVQDGDLITTDNTVTEAEGQTPVLHVFGTFANMEVTVNGVKYVFDVKTKSYTAEGRAAGFNALYCDGENPQTLVLESHIGSYPVTAIAPTAFANTDGHSLKRVIVPATVVTVGEGAFLDNVGMESAVFLAPEVTMKGSFSEGEDGNTTPFYGCSEVAGGKTTTLNVYYNSIVYEGKNTNLKWTRFRRSGSGLIFDRYYIGCDPINGGIDYDHKGGGALHTAGSWSVVNTKVTSVVEEIKVEEFVASRVPQGLINSNYSQEQGDALATELVNLLAAYKNEVNDAKYIVNVNVTNISGDVTVAVTVSLNEPVEVKVKSAVGFTYTLGEKQTIAATEGTATETMKVVKAGENVLLYKPEATGYIFLGWAVASGANGELTFVGQTTAYSPETVYYAIWGTNKLGDVVEASIATSGSSLPTTLSGNGKWYDKNWNEVTEISTTNTVVYTPSKVTVSVVITGNGYNNFYKGSDKGGDKVAKAKSSYTVTVEVWQSSKITIKVEQSGEILNINGTQYCAYKTGSGGAMNNDRRRFTIIDGDKDKLVNNELTVYDNITITYTF